MDNVIFCQSIVFYVKTDQESRPFYKQLASDIDRRYSIDRWARSFKAITWDEIKMLAHTDTNLEEATSTIYQPTEDEQLEQQRWARENRIRLENGWKYREEKLRDELSSLLQECHSLLQ